VRPAQCSADADATAIYGSRGSNGVILITTKKGKAGKTKVDLNVYTGFGKVTRSINLLNTQQYLEMRNEAFKNDAVIPNTSNAYDIGSSSLRFKDLYLANGTIDFDKNKFSEVTVTIPEAKNSFSYKISQLPDFKPADYEVKNLQFFVDQNEYEFKIKLNPEIKTMFANYPVVDYESYFNIPLSNETYTSLIPLIRKNIKGMNTRNGVDYLAANLLNLKVLDCPNAAPVSGIHCGALDPITPDVRVSGSPCSLGRFHDDVLHCQSHLNEDRQLRTAQTSCPGVDRYSMRGGEEKPTLALPCCRARGGIT